MANKIVEKRELLNMSQKELADACGMSQQLICDIEKERCKPSVNTALKLAQALGNCDVKDLF